MPILETLALAGLNLGVNVLGSALGSLFSGGDREKAERAAREADEIVNRIGAPPDLAKEILLDKFREVGVYSPQLEQRVNLEASKLSQLKEDPRLREAQFSALQRFGREAEGRTPEFEAKLRQAEMQQRKAVAGQQLALQQQMAARGLGSSGALLGLQQQAIQSEADRAAMQSDAAAIEAQRMALDAARQYGGMAGQVRGQDFDVERTRLSAEDQFALQRFNEEMGRQQRNIGSLNAAQLRNLQEQQRIADMNIAQTNAERQRQRAMQQQMWQNELARAQLQAGVKSGQAQRYQQQAGTTQQAWTGMGGAAGAGITALGGQYLKNLQDSSTTKEKDVKAPSSTAGAGSRFSLSEGQYSIPNAPSFPDYTPEEPDEDSSGFKRLYTTSGATG